MALAGGVGLEDELGRVNLADGDEGDCGGVAVGAVGRRSVIWVRTRSRLAAMVSTSTGGGEIISGLGGEGRGCGALADERSDVGAEEFGGAHEFGVGEGGGGHLEVKTGYAAEGLVDAGDLVGDGFGAADHEGAGGPRRAS